MNHIREHMLDYAIDRPTPNRGGSIIPRFIVMHYTAGASADSAVRTLTRRGSRVSAHLTVDLDGSVYQHAPFNVKTWHAGPSRHMGYHNLNSHSIGIEIVNLGWMRKKGGNYVRDNLRVPVGRFPTIQHPHRRVGSGMLYWPEYPERQLDAVEDIAKMLVEDYPIIDIVTHEEIDTRGWKTDPGPAFPMPRYKMLLNERERGEDTFVVTASKLNVRGGPGNSFSVITSVRVGHTVTPIGQHGDWVRISDDGWVHGAYLRRA